jgi:peptidoglycan/xylan/chitin deacetylase (PgdA/CDA1 family)
VAALTFDDGPHPVFTPRLLDLLRRRGLRATFFLVGQAAQAYPELVRRIAADGHVIGNHTWDHPPLVLVPGRERRRQMRRCQQAIAPLGTRFFRPPYGEHTTALRLDALWCGLDVIGWNVDVDDWFDTDIARMSRRLTTTVGPGSIVLMHDAIHDRGEPRLGRTLAHQACLDRSAAFSALDSALDDLTSRLQFVTITELLASGPAIHRS